MSKRSPDTRLEDELVPKGQKKPFVGLLNQGGRFGQSTTTTGKNSKDRPNP